MKLPHILSRRPKPDQSLFEWRVCPFCRGPIEFGVREESAMCMDCGRTWTRILTGGEI